MTSSQGLEKSLGINELSGKADKKLREFFQNDHNTILFQIIMSFTFGVIFSPWSYGFAIYLIWLFVYELIYGLAVEFDPKVWTLDKRLGIICASFFGWVLGRSLSNLHIFAEKPGENFFGLGSGNRTAPTPVPFGHYNPNPEINKTHHYVPGPPSSNPDPSSPSFEKSLLKRNKAYRPGKNLTKAERAQHVQRLISSKKLNPHAAAALKGILKDLN